MRFDKKNLSHASATKKKKRLKDLKFRTFIDFFNDVIAVKGLTVFSSCVLLRRSFSVEQ